MNVECKDLDRILREEDPAQLDALARHAENCAECAYELRIWSELSLAARGMYKTWESPALWPRIRESLVLESHAEATRPARGSFAWFGQRWFGHRFVLHWQTAVAALALVAVTATGTWMFLRQHQPPRVDTSKFGTPTPESQKRLLTDQALREAQDAEQTYQKSIDKLAALAGPKLEHASTPLLSSYREKILVLDAAINECKASQQNNPLNAHLRQELLSMYQEKKRTLEAVIRED
jgi:hypothetical protein